MLCAEENEMIQAFVAQRAKKPLDECLAIGRAPRSANDLGPHSGQGSVKAVREFTVPVVLDESHPQAGVACLVHEHLGLGRNPAFIGMQRGRREDDSPCLDMQENQDKGVADTFHRQDFLT